MATGEQLIDRVVKTVDDPSLDTGEILELLGEGLLAIASVVLLPALEETDPVDTIIDANTVSLPATFHRGLFDCQEQDTSNPVRVLNSKRQLLAKYARLDQEGMVRHVCRSGDNLIYQPMPTEVRTLTLSFYRLPDTLIESSSPNCLPVRYQKALFHYACYNLFDDIEDGMEGAKINTLRHQGHFDELVREIELFFRDSQSRPAPPVISGEYL